MSSSAFMNTFSHATELVLARCGNSVETRLLLENFRSRIQSEKHDPRKNRRLFVDPVEESQRQEIPLKVVESVCRELNRLQVLHVWVRAVCPVCHDEVEPIIIETDDPNEFGQVLSEPCPCCTQIHDDLGWDCIFTCYAFNFSLVDAPFKISRFLRKVKELPGPAGPKPKPSWLSRALGAVIEWGRDCFFRRRAETPIKQVVSALETNESIEQLPLPHSLMLTSVKWCCSILFLLVAFTVGVYLVCGSIAAIVTGIFCLFLFLIFSNFILKALSSVAAPARYLFTGGMFIATMLLARSAGINVESALGQKIPWEFKFKFGETDFYSLGAAVTVVIVTFVTVAVVTCWKPTK